ncbi:MAG: hypothetical protein IKU57_04005 [Oscillospiraceae bacterium]|nr:hypothetical protein [Oscillospiraceae bacterium]
MKKKILRIISCVITLALLLIFLLAAIQITERKSSIIKYHDFFQEELEYDAMFFGSSRMINGVFPMQLWQQHGFTSYNFGGHANRISTSYWVMKNAFDYKKPKLVVIDCSSLFADERAHTQYQYLHISMDAFPLSGTKIAAVNDLLRDDETENAAAMRTDLLFPFSTYHNRWTELEQRDFVTQYSSQKGAEARVNVATPNPLPKEDTAKALIKRTISRDYLERMIRECQEEDIQVLLVYLPFPYQTIHMSEARTAAKIAKEHNINFINFLELEIVNYETDCYDADSHLNPSGAYKVTEYLGNYIEEHYNLEDKRDVPAYAQWHTDYEAYLQHRKDLFLNTADSAYDVMSLMKEDSFDYLIRADEASLSKEKMQILLDNLGVDASHFPEGGGYVLIHNTSGQITYFDESALLSGNAATLLGDLQLALTEESATYSLNGEVVHRMDRSDWDKEPLLFFAFDDDGTCVAKSY